MIEQPITVGIDVAIDYLDVATLPTSELYRVNNDAAGHVG